MIKSQAIKGEYCEKQASVTPQKSIGIIGSRTLPYTLAIQVGLITQDLIKRKYHIATGGCHRCRSIRHRTPVKARPVRPLHRVFALAKLT